MVLRCSPPSPTRPTPSATLSLKPWSHQYNIFSHEAASLQHAIAQESTASSTRTEQHGETVRHRSDQPVLSRLGTTSWLLGKICCIGKTRPWLERLVADGVSIGGRAQHPPTTATCLSLSPFLPLRGYHKSPKVQERLERCFLKKATKYV